MSNEPKFANEGEKRLAALDAAIEQGIADADAGRGKPVDEVFDRLQARVRALAAKSKS